MMRHNVGMMKTYTYLYALICRGTRNLNTLKYHNNIIFITYSDDMVAYRNHQASAVCAVVCASNAFDIIVKGKNASEPKSYRSIIGHSFSSRVGTSAFL